VKSIKYIFKHVNKGSNMAVLQIQNTDVNAPRLNDNDEIMRQKLAGISAPMKLSGVSLVSQFMNGSQQLYIYLSILKTASAYFSPTRQQLSVP
jgi:hypothetical protein